RKHLHSFLEGLRAFGRGRSAEAAAGFLQTAQARPQSVTAALALATALLLEGDLNGAEQSLARAVRLLPRDDELAELHRRVKRLAGEAPPAPRPLPTTPTTPPKVGDVLDGWRLEAPLGRGSGAIFRASKQGRSVALKVLPLEQSRNPALVDRFRREV